MVTFQARTQIPEDMLFDYDYVPEPHAFRPGLVSLRMLYLVSQDAPSTLTGSGGMQVRDGNGAIIAGPFSASPVAGTRLVPA